ncbi:hypothetical protein ACP26L_12240 [Paenibacillus sp. S-38]|uniref:hypothetical protein n=1 Tax=Paenibacillus sp. S-38 TaxID=3416710 RepID=UPI003CF3D8E9
MDPQQLIGSGRVGRAERPCPRAAQAYDRTAVPLQAVPYFAWSNRTPGEMTVWIRSS